MTSQPLLFQLQHDRWQERVSIERREKHKFEDRSPLQW